MRHLNRSSTWKGNSVKRRIDCILIFILMAVLSLTFLSHLHAHTLGQSYVYLKIHDDRLTGRFEIALDDLNKALGHEILEETYTGGQPPENIYEVYDYFRKHVSFSHNDIPFEITFTGADTLKAGTTYFLLNFILIKDNPLPGVLDIDYSVMFDVDKNHTGMVLIEQYWKANIFNNESHPSLIFSNTDRNQQLNIAGYSVFTGFLGIIKLGVEHIWKGIDHILFLVALILPAAMVRRQNEWHPVQKFRPAFIYVVKIVTLFTIAHSITLSLAAMNIIELPSRLVESIIALSIAIAAMDILFPVFHLRIGWVVFIFGLFHGFGFASVLTQLGVLGEHKLLSLFGFNLGVEIGQLAVVCIIFPLLYHARRFTFFPKIIMRYGAITLILMAMVWFVERSILEAPFYSFLKLSSS